MLLSAATCCFCVALFLSPPPQRPAAIVAEAQLPTPSLVHWLAVGPGLATWFHGDASLAPYGEACRDFWADVTALSVIAREPAMEPQAVYRFRSALAPLRIADTRGFLTALRALLDRRACARLPTRDRRVDGLREPTRDFLISCRTALEGMALTSGVPRDTGECLLRFFRLRLALASFAARQGAPLDGPAIVAHLFLEEALRSAPLRVATMLDYARRWVAFEKADEPARLFAMTAYLSWLQRPRDKTRSAVLAAAVGLLVHMAQTPASRRLAAELQLAVAHRTDKALAVRLVAQIAERDEWPGLAAYYRGWSLYAAGDADEASDSLDEALRAEPSNATFLAARDELRSGLASGPADLVFSEELSPVGAQLVFDDGEGGVHLSYALGSDFRGLRDASLPRR